MNIFLAILVGIIGGILASFLLHLLVWILAIILLNLPQKLQFLNKGLDSHIKERYKSFLNKTDDSNNGNYKRRFFKCIKYIIHDFYVEWHIGLQDRNCRISNKESNNPNNDSSSKGTFAFIPYSIKQPFKYIFGNLFHVKRIIGRGKNDVNNQNRTLPA